MFATLAWLMARTVQPSLGRDAMGLVQVNAWAELTGLDPTNLGERITLLSSMQEREFTSGCRAAILFHAAYQANEETRRRDRLGGATDDGAEFARDGTDEVSILWDQLWQRLSS